MQPTMKLRFVLRNKYPEQPTHAHYEKILQQWWKTTDDEYRKAGESGDLLRAGEWRDVPVETE